MRDYELTYILRTSLDEEGQTAAVERVNNLIQHGSGTITEVHAWGRRHLNYPIAHQRDGFYITTRFSIPPVSLQTFENDLRLNENVLRYLLVSQAEVPVRPPTPAIPPPPAQAHAGTTVIRHDLLDEEDEDDDLPADIDPDLVPAAEE